MHKQGLCGSLMDHRFSDHFMEKRSYLIQLESHNIRSEIRKQLRAFFQALGSSLKNNLAYIFFTFRLGTQRLKQMHQGIALNYTVT